MSTPLRVFQWATGNSGTRSLRAVIEHPDLELVGVHVHAGDKVGKDAGELCGAGPTGVEMADFSFTPGCAAVDAGASLELRNVGDVPHTFTVSGTDVDVNVPAGESATTDLADVGAGTYEVICTLHPQMTGALQVR